MPGFEKTFKFMNFLFYENFLCTLDLWGEGQKLSTSKKLRQKC